VKAFLLERTELVIEGVSSVLTETLPPPPVTWPTFEEFVAGYADMLRGLGWIVLHEHDDISLHRTYKNGKMVNTPDVRLYFEATTCDLLFDGKTVTETNHRDRQRPWTLRVKKQNPKAFGNFVKAQLAFLEAAKLLAPRKK
jgi:hypothetical protein